MNLDLKSVTVPETRYFVCDYASTRYQVLITLSSENTYVISLPQFKLSLETTSPLNVEYKLVELGLSKTDSAVVQTIVANAL